MSRVTNVILTFGCENYEQKINNINKWLKKDFNGCLNKVGNCCTGGTKCLETEIFIGAFNYLEIDEFIKVVISQNWDEPEYLQLMIQGDDDDMFTIYTA